MAEIEGAKLRDGAFRVTVSEGKSQTVHQVSVSDDEARRFGRGTSPEALLEESFRFLLERESKESILEHFELSVIERYFPEYVVEIRRRLG